jgi:hypothetical protein
VLTTRPSNPCPPAPGELARGAHFLAFTDPGVIAQDDGAHLGLLEVQGQAGHALPKSSISLSMASVRPFDFGHAVADLAHGADVLSGHRS